MEKFKADICPACTQTKNYPLNLDRGTGLTVLAISHAVERLRRNRIHLQNDMEIATNTFGGLKALVEAGYMTPTMLRNATRARYHGLIAFADKEGGTGEYVLTHKGQEFLRGAKVSRTVVVDKVNKRTAGYLDENDKVTLFDLLDHPLAWSVPRFEINEDGSFQPPML